MPHTETRVRCLGLELGGGKGNRTALVVLDYYPKEQKIFLVDTQVQVSGTREETGDEVLLETIRHYKADFMAVNAPLSLPPCFTCELPECPGYRKCSVPAIEWMREEGERLGLEAQKAPTPYTQRPIDIAMRGILQQGLSVSVPVDETLGSGPAPLAARMRYLSRHLGDLQVFEVNPKLVMARFTEWFAITSRQLKRYRDINEGLAQRIQMLKAMGDGIEENIPQLFLYEEDADALCRELAVFDAFVCAFTAVYRFAGQTENRIPGFNKDWSSTVVPRRRLRPTQARVRVDTD